MTVQIPESLHEILGETQTRAELAVVAAYATVVSGWILSRADLLTGVPVWRAILASLLILDIVAGSGANLTRGVNRYYAHRPRHRVVFISIHLHLIAIAILLGASLGPVVAIWGYTILTALVVNRLYGSALQTLVGGVGLALGILIVVALTPTLGGGLAAVAALFLMKVEFAFAVDHYGDSTAVGSV